MTAVNEQIYQHTIAVLVENEPGVLARVVGLFSGRGYNIESLTVAETRRGRHLSRITIVISGTPMVIEQIKAQLIRQIIEATDIVNWPEATAKILSIKKIWINTGPAEKPSEAHLNEEFKSVLEEAISNNEIFNYSFDSLSKFMSTEMSPDGNFRIFNW